jgi:hypothetical protein
MTEVVIDKSFLDGASSVRMRNLCATHACLFTETLFFEAMTTGLLSRTRCFSKLPDKTNPVFLLPRSGTLIAFECEQQRPCGFLTEHRVRESFVFNAGLRDGTYVAPPEVERTLAQWRADVETDTRSFLHRCQSVHEFFPELIGIEFTDFPAAIADARRRVGVDVELIRRIYAGIAAEGGAANAPSAAALGPEWFFFRWLQAQLLAALRMFQRYQCRIPDPPSTGVLLRAEHSMHDTDYVALAALTGVIATCDAEVAEDFQLLRPDGVVLRR